MSRVGALEPIFTGPWTKAYNFICEDGSNIQAEEVMAETPLSFRLPAQLIALLTEDELQLQEEMLPLTRLPAPTGALAQEMVDRHQQLIRSYAAARDRLLAHTGPFFKRSTLKGDASLEFVPVNLHLQRLQVQNQTLLDVLTVGAFTAFSQNYRDGGLLQYAHLLGGRPLPTTLCSCLPRMRDRLASGSRSTEAGGKASAVYQADNAVDCIEDARAILLEAFASLLEDSGSNNHTPLIEVIREQSSRIETAVRSPVISEGHKFLLSNAVADPPVLAHVSSPLDGRLSSLPSAPPCLAPWPALPAAVSTAAVGATLSTGSARWAALSALRAASDSALSAARLARALARLREERRTQQLRDNARHRRDVCFTHAVTAASVALLARMWCRPLEPALLRLWASAGALLQFEGLLSYYGNEAHMVQDMVVAVQDLETVEFVVQPVLDPAQELVLPEVHMEGGRGRLRVHLPAPRGLFPASAEPALDVRFHVCAVFFNVGINEQATFAEYVAGTAPQRAVNEEAYRKLADYVNVLSQLRLISDRDGPAASVSELLVQLGQQLLSPQAKNVAVLQLASHICRRVSGLRFCSCKSAKDRTSMSVTLEQVNVLTSECRLARSERQRALTAMRTSGSRRHNALKNVGSPRFSFHTLQLLTMPPEYRPPAGTYGAVQS